ncbi:MAG: transporter substrate-binding domain-containing protein [Pseudomonadota bacterium]
MRLALPSLLLLALLATPSAGAAPLHLCFEDVPQPPWTMPDGSGLNLALLKRVEALTGETFILSSRPWTRCIEETRIGRMDGLIGAADTAERRAFSLPPMLSDGSPDPARALHHTKVNIFVRVDSGASWDGTVLHNPRGSVITQRGYFIGDLMRARGQRVIDTVKSSDEALRLLVTGTADVAALMELASQSMLRDDPRLRGRVAKAPVPFTSMPLYLLFSRTTYQQNPERIEAIWNAVATAKANPAYRKQEAAQTRRLDED